MWGDNFRHWFELFAGMVVYRPGGTGEHVSDGWLNVDDIENRFWREKLLIQGRPYDANDQSQRNQLFGAILNNAAALCAAKLLERRRQIMPPSLDYRVTAVGRRIDNWGYGDKPGLRKRVLFFVIEAAFRLRRYWKFVAIGAAGWAALNAFKFYFAALQWLSNDLFALLSAACVTALLWVIHKALFRS